MAENKIRTLKEIRAVADEQQFKHVRLCDLSGDPIVAYNPAHGKKPSDLTKKWTEIERRLKQCDAGIYIVECRARFGGRERAYQYHLGNKNFDASQLNDTTQNSGNLAARKQEPVADKRTSTDKLLSVDTALEYATENATLRAENEGLRNEIARQKTYIAELEAELDSDEGVNDNTKGMQEFWESASSTLLPVADRVIGLFERKQKLSESKFLAEKGYDIPGLKKSGRGERRQKQKDFNQNVPNPDDADWEQYVDWASQLPDEEFNAHLERVQKSSQVVYDALCEALGVEFDDDDDNATGTN